MQSIHSPEYKVFLKRLRECRQAKRMTQAQVAKALGKPQSFVSKIESGERRLDPMELKALAKLYGVSVDRLLGHGKSQ